MHADDHNFAKKGVIIIPFLQNFIAFLTLKDGH